MFSRFPPPTVVTAGISLTGSVAAWQPLGSDDRRNVVVVVVVIVVVVIVAVLVVCLLPSSLLP